MGKFSLLAALGVLVLLAVARAMPQPGSNSSSEELAEAGEIKDELARLRKLIEETNMMCQNNSGSVDANDTQSVAMIATMVCMLMSVDVANIESDMSTLSNETRTTLYPKYCPQLKRAGSCLDDLLKALRPCFNEQGLNNVLAVMGMYPDAVDLICKNDGEVIFKLAEPKYKECVEKLRDIVEECTVPFAAQSEDWNIANLTETQMGTFSGLRQCMEDKLNDCEAPDLISVYDLFHNTLFRLDSSRNYMPKVTHNETNAVNEKKYQRVTFRLLLI